MNQILLLLGLIIVVGGVVLIIVGQRQNEKTPKLYKWLIGLGLILLLFSTSFKIIPTGFTGVRTTFGQIDDVTLQNGYNVKIPFVQSITLVNNKQQDNVFTIRIWGESEEQTVVFAEGVTVTYQIANDRSAWIFANVADYTNNLVSYDLVASAFKTGAKKCPTEDVTNRGVIEPLTKDEIQKSLNEKYGDGTVKVLKVVISNMDFEDSYNEAIAQKQIAQQNYEISAVENETAIEKAAADAEVRRKQAQGVADATLIEAEAKAEANRIVAESITDKTIAQDYLEKWDGVLPKVSGNGDYILDVPGLTD